MAKPFKFRYVNEITGGFVLLVLAALVIGIVLTGHAQRWFEPVHEITLFFPPEGSYGLQKGAEVRILETPVGEIRSISVANDGTMSAVATVRGNFIRFVRVDSKAIIKKKLGLAGDAYVEITKGRGEPLPTDGASLNCVKDTELMEQIRQLVEQLKNAILPTIEQARLAIEAYTKVATNLRDPEGNLQKLLANINLLADGLQKGEGPAGKLLKDPQMAGELQETTRKINVALDEVNRILQDVQRTTAKLPGMADTVGGEVQDLPGLVLQTQETLRESQKLIVALQNHWLLRGYVDQTKPTMRIPPATVSSTNGGGGR